MKGYFTAENLGRVNKTLAMKQSPEKQTEQNLAQQETLKETEESVENVENQTMPSRISFKDDRPDERALKKFILQ